MKQIKQGSIVDYAGEEYVFLGYVCEDSDILYALEIDRLNAFRYWLTKEQKYLKRVNTYLIYHPVVANTTLDNMQMKSVIEKYMKVKRQKIDVTSYILKQKLITGTVVYSYEELMHRIKKILLKTEKENEQYLKELRMEFDVINHISINSIFSNSLQLVDFNKIEKVTRNKNGVETYAYVYDNKQNKAKWYDRKSADIDCEFQRFLEGVIC